MALLLLTDLPWSSITAFSVIFLLISALLSHLLLGDRPYAGFPVISSDKVAFQKDGMAILRKGDDITHSGWFQVNTGAGYKIVVPRRFAHELRNSPDLDFRANVRREMMGDFNGFDSIHEGTRKDGLIPEVVKSKITLALASLTEDIADETNDAVSRNLGDDKEWKTKEIKTILLDIVARVSTRVFAGVELARDEKFLDIAKLNTILSFLGAQELLKRPKLLRPVWQWLSPLLWALRRQVREARSLIQPVLQRHLAEAQTAYLKGEHVPRNSFTWMTEASTGKAAPDYVAGQLSLSLAAIHTTTEALSRCILTLCDTPELADDLRREMITVLRADGWAKTSLYKMRLLDSFLKEVQRHQPSSAVSMMRYCKNDIVVSDGTKIPRGSQIMVMDSGPRDPKVHTNPDQFDAYRFVKMRQVSGEENKHQMATADPTILSFGYGKYSCPGRFFAANELKIILCFLLLQYDFQYPADAPIRPKDIQFEHSNSTDPAMRVQIRRRQAEVDLLDPQT